VASIRRTSLAKTKGGTIVVVKAGQFMFPLRRSP
jgi:hypothetical protein